MRSGQGLSILPIALLCAFLATGSCGRNSGSAETQYAKALQLMHTGNFDLAIAESEHGEQRKEADAQMRCRFRLLRIESLFLADKLAEVDKLLAVPPGQVSPEYAARVLIFAARRAVSKSDFDKAATLTGDALRLAEQMNRVDILAEAEVQMGSLLGRQKRYSEAESAFHAALKHSQDSGDILRQAAAVNNLGMLRMLRTRCEEAIVLFGEAEALWRRVQATYFVQFAHNNRAICYGALGDFEKALDFRKQSVETQAAGVRKANALGEIGRLLIADEEPRQAVVYYRQALEMARRFGSQPDAARWAGNLTQALAATGDWSGAEQALAEATKLQPETRSRLYLELNAADIALGRGRAADALAKYKSTIAASADDPSVLLESHAGAANAYTALEQPQAATAHYEAALKVIETAWGELGRNENKITFLSRLTKFYRDYVDALMTRGEVEKALATADRSRARLLSQRLSREVKQASLDYRSVSRQSGSVWLSYWLAPRRSFLWVVTPKEIRSFTLPPAAGIEQLVRDYRGFIEGSMRDPMTSPNEAGKALYEKLIAPAAPFLKKDADVVIIPDGPLHQLSFDALPVYAPTPHYLVHDYAIAIAPSLGAYRASPPSAGPREALIIGDPLSGGADFPPLPYAAAEIATVQKRLSPMTVRVLTKEAARPDAWKTAEPSKYSIIHIAAHAEANEQDPLQSAIILSPKPSPRLFAKDMIDTQLRADLVTLSACRSSGAKAYRGEGLVGFAWTFLQAGSHAVVAGLWDVADESTSLLMDRMYEGIARKESPARALRQARISLQQTQYSKPFYWAPFQCYVR